MSIAQLAEAEMAELHDRPKLAHEQVLTLLQGSAQQAVDLFAEPEAVVVTVLWDRRLGELPGAVVVGRRGEVLQPEVACRLAAQLARAAAQLLAQVNQQLRQRDAGPVPRGPDPAEEQRPKDD